MTNPDELERAVERPAWMHRDFRYAPSSAEAIAARELCVPGPDWVPNLQADNRRMKAEITALLSANREMRAALEPFVSAAENMDGDEPDSLTIWENPEAMSLTFGDLRKARSALTTQRRDGE